MTLPGQHRSPTYTRERLADVARRYYLDDRTKLDIARETGLSRFAVARMLDRARALGIVTITVDGTGGSDLPHRPPAPRAVEADRPAPVDEQMSTHLAEHLGLDEALVVRASGTAAAVRRQVGRAAARWIRDCVAQGDVVGIATTDPGTGSTSRDAAWEAAEAFVAPVGVTVTDLPPVATSGDSTDATEDPWDALTAVLVDPDVAMGTPGLRRVPHVVVVAAGAGAAGPLTDAALSGPATVVVTDVAAAIAVLGEGRAPTDAR